VGSHNHGSREIDNLPVAEALDPDLNHQSAQLKVADNQICTERIGKNTCDPDPDAIPVDDPQRDITQDGRSENNAAPCRNNLHAPFEGDDHTHDGHCHTDGCALFEILVYDPLARKPVIECPCTENDHNHSDLVQAILRSGIKPPVNLYNLPFRQKPYTDTYPGREHILIPGLRAPPAC
jgi:hypothetical protein